MPKRPNKSHLQMLTTSERLATFDRQEKVMSMFSDNAKTYIQLSGAALAVTLTFAREVLHVPPGQNIANGWMIGMWTCFAVAIISGAFYQYLAVKYVESCIDWEHSAAWDWLQAGYVYGIMLFSFYGGTIIFTVYAIVSLRHT